MTDRLRIALAQLNPVMGDIAGNLAKAQRARAEAAKAKPTSFCSPNSSSAAIRRKTSC